MRWHKCVASDESNFEEDINLPQTKLYFALFEGFRYFLNLYIEIGQ